ncbi:CSD domain-containing protein [Durusdinium trenchii]|uniref:CSD domain-containing protein n=1 Tax=Durusdinium trenchii TaxID=1381693 RepID=A0ABP0KT65_9DINO
MVLKKDSRNPPARSEGIVNYVNVDQGYGWIRCSPAEKQFGSDVLITELQDLALGDWVQFDMKRDDHGRAQAHRISKQPQQLKTLAELMGEAASSRPSSDPDAVITALKQKRDLRSIGVPLWQPQKASPLLCAYAPAPPPAPSSTAGADAVAADPAVAALVPCVGSPCLQPSGKERGEEILNFMRNGHGSPPLRPLPEQMDRRPSFTGLPPPPPPGDGPAMATAPPPPPPPPRRDGGGVALLSRGQPPPWQDSNWLNEAPPPPPPPEVDPKRTAGVNVPRPGPSQLLQMQIEHPTGEDSGNFEALEKEWHQAPASSSTGRRGGGERYDGVIFKIGPTYGFIRSPQVRDPVFVDRKQLPGMEIGQQVNFKPQVGKKGVSAVDVQVEGTVEPDEKEEEGGALNYVGVLKKLQVDANKKAFGFILCESDAWEGDVFVSKKVLESHKDLKLGDKLRFSVKVKKNKAEAVKLELISAPDEDEEVSGPDMLGSIKSFDESSGYGFIRSAQAMEAYSRDVFLHRKQLRHFKVGDTVQFKVKLSRDGLPQALKLRETDQVLPPFEPHPTEESKVPEKETFLGEIKSFSPINGFGFIQNSILREKYGRDVFLHESQFEGLKIGDSVRFVLQIKDGKPQALEVKRVSKKSLTSPLMASVPAPEVPAIESEEPSPVDPAVLEKLLLDDGNRKLLRACASERPNSLQELRDSLETGAEVNARDVTGQTAIMVCALNMRGADRKCKLLIEHRADVLLPSDQQGSQTTLQWVKERINPSFAEYLEALSKGEAASLDVALDAPRADDF